MFYTRRTKKHDMRKIGFLMTALLLGLTLSLQAQMTDDQVVEYVKTALSSGKTQEQVGKELLQLGVTQEQAERIYARVRAQQGSGTQETGAESEGFGRNSGAAGRRTLREQTYEQDYFENQRTVQPRKRTRRTVTLDPNRDQSSFDRQTEALNKGTDFTAMMESVRQPGSSGEIPDSLLIFGLDIFDGENLTFEPNENLATPETYQLGPGDQLLIEIFGYSEGSYNKTISPEGTINISQIGRVQLGGLTIKEAREKLRRALVSKYASVGGSNPNSTVSITLSNIRTIQVNVMGEVEMPGTFRLSPFATVFNALYNAGGVTENGSMRAIKVIRSGEQIATVDVYGYLFNGRSDSDITLKEGDVVIVPPYVNLVRAGGNVKRPMFYELAEGETLSDLVQYAGGYSSKAHQDDIRVIRQLGAERQIYTVKQPDVAGFAMADGDEVYVEATMERFSNKVEIKGAVFRPGMYEYGGGIATVRQLIDAAGGLKEDAFTGRAVLVREKEDLTFESRSVDLAGILAGRADDILLRKNDILTISSNKELSDPGTLTINGYVQNPGVFPFVANTTVEDLILLAGGLLDGASLSRVDIARRVSDPYSQMPSDTVGQTFTFALQDGLLEKEGERFVLEPYDVVSVRRSPSFRTQKFVSVTGEVAFPGDFVLLNEGERVSELVKRAGGATNHAFLKGATLTRRLTDEERVMQIAKLQMLSGAAASRDSLDLDQIRVGETYSVGVELDKALARPGSEYDLILREGDRIFVPEQLSTVRISGAVMYPNTAIYVPGKGVEHYINAAGGYGARARRSRVYIVYMNGRVQKAGAGGQVEPGCEIIVPERPERQGMSAGEILGISSSATSLATVMITLINVMSKK
jgi:protein involved in polysaccharide export with SLBB domain